MIEATPEDDLFTEPADNAQNTSDFDTLATGMAEFYWGLRRRKIPRKEAFNFTELFLNYMLTMGGRV